MIPLFAFLKAQTLPLHKLRFDILLAQLTATFLHHAPSTEHQLRVA